MVARTRSLRFRWSCVAWLCACFATACSISPKPEPPVDALPELDPSTVRITPARDYGDPTGIEGGPGSASPPGATLRAWNLDEPTDPTDVVVGEDGSFAAHFDVFVGQEVRVQILAGTHRSTPMDFVVTSATGPAQPATRALGECLALDPPLEAVYPAVSSIRIVNACSGAVEIAAPVLRRPVPGLSAGQGTTWPVTLAPGAETELALNVQQGIGVFEEVLFVSATSPQTDRRPITLRGTAP